MMKQITTLMIIALLWFSTLFTLTIPIHTDTEASLTKLTATGHDFYTILSYDRGTGLTRIIVQALEANTNVTLDTNWDGSPEYSWNSGSVPFNTTVFYGDDNTIPPGTHIHGSSPILAAQWHEIQPSPWPDSGALALLPYELWGTQYIAPNYYTGKIEVTAPTPGTIVNVDQDNDGVPELTWTSNDTNRHQFWGDHDIEYYVANITATHPIEVATVHGMFDSFAGTPSFAMISLPLNLQGQEHYSIQQFPEFPDYGHEWIGVSCPFLPCTVKIQPDVNLSDIREYNLSSYVDSLEQVRSSRIETPSPIINMISYMNSTLPSEGYYLTFARDYGAYVDVEVAATCVPTNQWGTDYFVLQDPADNELGTFKRLIGIIAPTEGTYITIDVDHDGLGEYEWTSTSSNINVTYTNLPAGSHIWGNKPFIAQQLVYRNDFKDARAIELLPVLGINHEIATTNVLPSRTIITQGLTIPINVTIANFGDFAETFNITLKAVNSTEIEIGNEKIALMKSSTETVSFSWNTSKISFGNYTLVAEASLIDKTLYDNINDSRIIRVTIFGNVNYDPVVDISDITLVIAAYAKTSNSYGWFDSNWYTNRDLNYDGIIDITDITLVIAEFGKHE